MQRWSGLNNILCIRPDNMGDLIMSGPALRMLKQSFNAHITVLTSTMAAAVAPFMPEVDKVITFDMPWVKTESATGTEALSSLINLISEQRFDAAVVFTVYSQNALPSAMIAYQAGIPKVLAYCRENPYGLITHWVPDQEPFAYILHQVERDMRLVAHVCDAATDERLHLISNGAQWPQIAESLKALGMRLDRPWLILHAGVSEVKRQCPETIWIEAATQLARAGHQILLTGSKADHELTARLQHAIGEGAFNSAGRFSIGQLITLIEHAPLLLSVNTGTVHIAAAVGTPVVVLYAQTNPQHTPWMVPHQVIEFQVPAGSKSRNQIVAYVDRMLYTEDPAPMPSPGAIVNAVTALIKRTSASGQRSHASLR